MKFRWLRQQLWVPPFRGYDSTWSEFWADIPWKQWYFWKQTNCQCLSVFFGDENPFYENLIVYCNRNRFVLFLTLETEELYVFPVIHTHSYSSSKNTTWYIKTFKTYRGDLTCCSHFGLPGFGSRISYLPRYQGDIVGLPPPGSELHITGNLKVGRVGCWTKKCWLETTDWNRESMVSQVTLWRGTWLKSNLIVRDEIHIVI